MENKHIQYPSMPFDIDDTVYYMEKVSERGGLKQMENLLQKLEI